MNNEFYNYQKDGVTQGLLIAFMTCRQKTKWSLQGWSYKKDSLPMTYGSIVHGILERVYDLVRLGKISKRPKEKLLRAISSKVEKQWKYENPKPSSEALKHLEYSLSMAEATLPAYFQHHWKKDLEKIKWLKLEQTFRIPYKTKDGRKTFIRGRKDGVYGVKNIGLFETKTKSMINVGDLIDTLGFEFQIMLYLWAMWQEHKQIPKEVTYNIIRRPSLYQRKNETLAAFAARVTKDILKRPKWYFIRLRISVSEKDLRQFSEELEQLICDFMDWCESHGTKHHYKNTSACIGKYGRCSFLDLCAKKDFTRYSKRKVVFKELEDL